MLTTPADARAGVEQGGYALIDVDDTVVEVHGYTKQGAGFGYNRVRGLNALVATLTATGAGAGDPRPAPTQGLDRVVARSQAAGGGRHQDRPSLLGPTAPVLVRMDSAFYGRGAVHAGGATPDSDSGRPRASYHRQAARIRAQYDETACRAPPPA